MRGAFICDVSSLPRGHYMRNMNDIASPLMKNYIDLSKPLCFGRAIGYGHAKYRRCMRMVTVFKVRYKVLKPTPHPKAGTPPPNHQHYIALNRSPWKRSVWVYKVPGLGAISGGTSCWPPLHLGSVQSGFEVACQCLFQRFYSWGGGGRGSSPHNQRGWFWVARGQFPDARGRLYN